MYIYNSLHFQLQNDSAKANGSHTECTLLLNPCPQHFLCGDQESSQQWQTKKHPGTETVVSCGLHHLLCCFPSTSMWLSYPFPSHPLTLSLIRVGSRSISWPVLSHFDFISKGRFPPASMKQATATARGMYIIHAREYIATYMTQLMK